MTKLTLKIFCYIAGIYAVLAVPIFFIDNYALAPIAALPLHLVYFLNEAGISGLLGKGDLCSWDYCDLTLAGNIVASLLTIGIALIISWLIASIMNCIKCKYCKK
ncbi:MAG: hypothetical protein GY804_10740 [Alphaproteobacteria bacterium]|nr:hypothetical protein [Alphaproteobacteria bacterium]